MKTYVYVSIAQGALDSAQKYTTTITQPWITSGVESATQDPYILPDYGKLQVEKAAIRLADQAAEIVQAAWEKDDQRFTHQEREAAVQG